MTYCYIATVSTAKRSTTYNVTGLQDRLSPAGWISRAAIKAVPFDLS